MGPRARSWIDVFGVFAPKLDKLKLAFYGRNASHPKGAWSSLVGATDALSSGDKEIAVSDDFDMFKRKWNDKILQSHPDLREGYHFIDIILSDSLPMVVPRYHMKAFLTDLGDPKRLLELEDTAMLASEPMGELDISISQAAESTKQEL